MLSFTFIYFYIYVIDLCVTFLLNEFLLQMHKT